MIVQVGVDSDYGRFSPLTEGLHQIVNQHLTRSVIYESVDLLPTDDCNPPHNAVCITATYSMQWVNFQKTTKSTDSFMFTGIIQGKGKLLEMRPAGGGMVFRLQADFDLENPQEGESIAVNGVCLTARNIGQRTFLVDISPESLSRTNLGKLATGDGVNLERALCLSDRLGGHLVSGHVDTTATVVSRNPVGNFVLFTFAISKNLSRYIIEKGSITIDGISLTVNSCDDSTFSVSIIPHTLEITLLGCLSQGDIVNIEVDLIGKYVESLLGGFNDKNVKKSRISAAFLAENGF